jgi:sec-independent protein translocase protein TatC
MPVIPQYKEILYTKLSSISKVSLNSTGGREMGEKYLTIIGHLEELRKVLIVSLLSLIPASILGWYLKDFALALLLKPLRAIDPNFKLQVLGLADKVFVDLKIALFLGLLIALPIIIWQIWSFILPALRANEKRVLSIVVPLTVLLFVAGIIFAYYTVFQIGVQFFFTYAQADGSNVLAAYALKEYVDFTITFLLPFGFVFELPLVVIVLTKFGLITPRFMSEKRKYAVLIIFIVAAIITPGPDIVSQIMVAIPLYLLYEISILMSYLLVRKKITAEYAIMFLLGGGKR